MAPAAPRHHRPLIFMLDTLTGTILCTWLALTAAIMAHTWPYPHGLLLVLVPAVGVVSRAWGFISAILGLAFSVFVFRLGLFMPLGSIEVESPTARTTLFWLVLCAAAAAYVFHRPNRRTNQYGNIRR